MITLRELINRPGVDFDILKLHIMYAEDWKNISYNFVEIAGLLSGISAPLSETPGGFVDGLNKDYSVTNSIHNIYSFAINGQFIHPADYTVDDKTISFVTPLGADLSGLPFTIVYN